MEDKVYECLADHVDRYWAGRTKERFTWQLGRISKILPRFSVVRVSPSGRHEPWVYATSGAWEIQSEERCEFFILSPEETPRHVETLTMVAALHADPAHRLTVGTTVGIGHGWMEGSLLDHLLVSVPYPCGPKLEYCFATPTLPIRYLWLVPVTQAEAQFVKTQGLDALEQRFDEAGIDYLNPLRRPVVA